MRHAPTAASLGVETANEGDLVVVEQPAGVAGNQIALGLGLIEPEAEVRLVALGMAVTAAIVATLERGGYDVEEMLALWDDIMSEAIRQLHGQPRLAPLARIIADLDAALTAYENPSNNAEARQLAHSMRVALEALRENQQLPRRHVLRTADAFADAMEWGSFPIDTTARVRAAVDMLRKLWGL